MRNAHEVDPWHVIGDYTFKITASFMTINALIPGMDKSSAIMVNILVFHK